MSDLEVRIGDRRVERADGWRIELVDEAEGLVRLTNGQGTTLVLVEGRGAERVVTLHGRRIEVSVRTWRERILAEAETAAASQHGPVEVRATLPGLVVAVAVEVGSEVEAGASLLTIEAMKMQNEVRAPRAGRVMEVAVAVGEAVATGAPLLRLE